MTGLDVEPGVARLSLPHTLASPRGHSSGRIGLPAAPTAAQDTSRPRAPVSPLPSLLDPPVPPPITYSPVIRTPRSPKIWRRDRRSRVGSLSSPSDSPGDKNGKHDADDTGAHVVSGSETTELNGHDRKLRSEAGSSEEDSDVAISGGATVDKFRSGVRKLIWKQHIQLQQYLDTWPSHSGSQESKAGRREQPLDTSDGARPEMNQQVSPTASSFMQRFVVTDCRPNALSNYFAEDDPMMNGARTPVTLQSAVRCAYINPQPQPTPSECPQKSLILPSATPISFKEMVGARDDMDDDDLPPLPPTLGTQSEVARFKKRCGSQMSLRTALPQTAECAWKNVRNRTSCRARVSTTLAYREGFTISSFLENWQAWLYMWTSHWIYEAVSAMFIVMNAVVIAWEIETATSAVNARDFPAEGLSTSAVGLTQKAHFDVFMVFFCVVYTVDLVLRMLAQRIYFFTSAEWRWNVFDIVVVVSALIEMLSWAFVSGQGSSAYHGVNISSLLRTVRLIRVIRIARALRALAWFRDLRILVSSLSSGVMAMTWSALIMGLVLFVFAVFFTEASLGYVAENPGLDTSNLRFFFGGLPETMASLFMSITGGEDWAAVLEPLEVLPLQYKFMFYLYIIFSSLAMLNVISAVFVDSTMQRSQNDRDYVVQTELQGKRDFMKTMEQVFEELDCNGSGEISLQELMDHMSDIKVTAYFSALDLDVKQVKKLFHLIDLDKSGSIDREEFIFGCLNLKGHAKNLDVAILQYETRWIRNLVIQLGEHLDDHFASVVAATQQKAMRENFSGPWNPSYSNRQHSPRRQAHGRRH